VFRRGFSSANGDAGRRPPGLFPLSLFLHAQSQAQLPISDERTDMARVAGCGGRSARSQALCSEKEINNNLWALGLAALRHQAARGGGDGVRRALKAKLGPSVSLDHPVKPPVLTAPAARHLSERSLLGERRSDSRCLYKYCVLSL